MFVFLSLCSGIIGERLPIRYYLTFGMFASGACTALFGLGYFYDVHSLGFYVVTQVRLRSTACRAEGRGCSGRRTTALPREEGQDCVLAEAGVAGLGSPPPLCDLNPDSRRLCCGRVASTASCLELPGAVRPRPG